MGSRRWPVLFYIEYIGVLEAWGGVGMGWGEGLYFQLA